VNAWNNGKPLGVPFFGNKGSAREFAKKGDKAKRLAMIKRRHRVWLRQQAEDTVPLEDESAGGGSDEVWFD
jgi:hypothetical protein